MGEWMQDVYIYCISDQKTGLIFYVGETSNTERRFKQHLKSQSTAFDNISEILKSGSYTIFRIIDKCQWGNHKKLEIFWMKVFVSLKHPLINRIHPYYLKKN